MGHRLALKFVGNLFILPDLVILFPLWPFTPLLYCNLYFAVSESSINIILYRVLVQHYFTIRNVNRRDTIETSYYTEVCFNKTVQ